MRVLITRPTDNARSTAEALRDIGVEPVVESLLTIEAVAGVAADLDQVQAVLLTSRNGVRALARETSLRDLPVYAVGDATAALARDLGFADVESASGDGAALADLVGRRLDPAAGPLLHGSGAAVAGELDDALAAKGFTVRCEVLYEARAVEALGATVHDLMSRRVLDAVMFFSPRTAQTFVILVEQAGLAAACANFDAICLSPAVGRALGALPFRDVRIAARPDTPAMIAAVTELRARLEPESLVPKTPDQETTEAEILPPEPAAAGSAIPPSGAAAEPEPVRPETADSGGEAASPAATPPRSGRGAMWAVLALLVIAGGAYLTWPMWGQRTEPGAGAGAGDAALAGRLARLEGAMRGLGDEREAALAGLRTGAGKTAASLGRLEQRIGALEQAGAVVPEASTVLSDRIDALDKRITQLAERGTTAQQGAQAAAPDAATVDRLSSLEARLEALAKAAGRPTADPAAVTSLATENRRLVEHVAALTERLAVLETARAKQLAGEGDTRGALVVAVGQLRDALGRAAPFVGAFDAVDALATGDRPVLDAVAILQPHTRRGIPTIAVLRERFASAAAAANRAAVAPEDGDWVRRMMARLASVVSVRRVGGDVEGDAPDAILARAEARLAENDLATADAELAALSGAPARAMAAWRQDAAVRLAAVRALADLTRLAIARLAVGAAGGD